MKKIMLFAGALMLVLTAAVSAQAPCNCGWILWSNRLITISPVEEVWKPLGGYPSYITCGTEAEKRTNNQRLLLKDGTLSPDKAAIWVCFPSDFDPREKK